MVTVLIAKAREIARVVNLLKDGGLQDEIVQNEYMSNYFGSRLYEAKKAFKFESKDENEQQDKKRTKYAQNRQSTVSTTYLPSVS